MHKKGTSASQVQCKHCNNSVHHNWKASRAQDHLCCCPNFNQLMTKTTNADRPNWFTFHEKSSNSSKTSKSTLQSSITSYGTTPLTKDQLMELHEKFAMHFYATGNAFMRVEEENLLSAFQIANPSVTLPNRHRLSGYLLDKCYNKLREKVDSILSADGMATCLSTDAWTNIKNESVVNYMVITPEQTLFLESVATGEQSHTAEWISDDLICVMYSMPCKVAGAVTDNTSANKKAWKILKEVYPT